MRSLTTLAVAATLSLASAPYAFADTVSDSYSGKTVSLLSGGSAGGGFSTVARVLGIHWQKNIPDNHRRMVDFMEAPAYVGHGFFAPPGTPADRVAALRYSFWRTVNDPALLADAQKRDIVVGPIKADKTQTVIETAMATPKPTLDDFEKMVKIAK